MATFRAPNGEWYTEDDILAKFGPETGPRMLADCRNTGDHHATPTDATATVDTLNAWLGNKDGDGAHLARHRSRSRQRSSRPAATGSHAPAMSKASGSRNVSRSRSCRRNSRPSTSTFCRLLVSDNGFHGVKPPHGTAPLARTTWNAVREAQKNVEATVVIAVGLHPPPGETQLPVPGEFAGWHRFSVCDAGGCIVLLADSAQWDIDYEEAFSLAHGREAMLTSLSCAGAHRAAGGSVRRLQIVALKNFRALHNSGYQFDTNCRSTVFGKAVGKFDPAEPWLLAGDLGCGQVSTNVLIQKENGFQGKWQTLAHEDGTVYAAGGSCTLIGATLSPDLPRAAVIDCQASGAVEQRAAANDEPGTSSEPVV